MVKFVEQMTFRQSRKGSRPLQTVRRLPAVDLSVLTERVVDVVQKQSLGRFRNVAQHSQYVIMPAFCADFVSFRQLSSVSTQYAQGLPICDLTPLGMPPSEIPEISQ
jgi:hypothetical protein